MLKQDAPAENINYKMERHDAATLFWALALLVLCSTGISTVWIDGEPSGGDMYLIWSPCMELHPVQGSVHILCSKLVDPFFYSK